VVLDGFNTKTGNLDSFMFGDHNLGFPVPKVVDGHLNNSLGVSYGMMLVKLNVNHIILLHLGNGMGCDKLGMKTFGHVGQVLEDTLDIHHHGITGAGDNGKLLRQKSCCAGYAVALKDLIGRTADPAELDPFGPF